MTHHRVLVGKECVRQHTEYTGEVYVEVQANATTQIQLSVAPVCERVMLSLSPIPLPVPGTGMGIAGDAAKVQTTSGEWRDGPSKGHFVKTMTMAQPLDGP